MDFPAMKRLLREKMKEYRNHRIISPPAIHPCGDTKRALVTEHRISMPLHHVDMEFAAKSTPTDTIALVDRVDSAFNSLESFDNRPTIDVYFAIIELITNSDVDESFVSSLSNPDLDPRKRAQAYLRRGDIDPSRSMIYLQGGPGFGCAAPISGLSLASSKSSWASAVLLGEVTNLDGLTIQRVVLMDQRGTGRSSPITKQSLRKMFPDLFIMDDDNDNDVSVSAERQLRKAKLSRAVAAAADYLAKFRADSIVRDAEWFREALCRPSVEDSDIEDVMPPRPWGAALGQSFGGFCLMTYLSSMKHPPRMCLFTGGIAPMNTPVREVYDRLWLRVQERNRKYYDQYPGDVDAVKRIVRRLISQPVELPSGGMITARMFLQLGLGLGGSPGSSFANIHGVISSAFLEDKNNDELSCSFFQECSAESIFRRCPPLLSVA